MSELRGSRVNPEYGEGAERDSEKQLRNGASLGGMNEKPDFTIGPPKRRRERPGIDIGVPDPDSDSHSADIESDFRVFLKKPASRLKIHEVLIHESPAHEISSELQV